MNFYVSNDEGTYFYARFFDFEISRSILPLRHSTYSIRVVYRKIKKKDIM
jgi:hypothetical protein